MLRRHRDFRLLWMGDAISQMGSAVTVLALPYLAVTVLHATPFEVGLLGTFEYLAFLIVGFPTGVWIDHARCRGVLIASDLGRAAFIGSVPVAALFHRLTLGHLYVVALGVGLLTVFFTVAYQSYVPRLIDEPQLEEANARLEMSRGVAEVSGPAVTGYLMAWLTAPLVLAADVASFVLSALFVSRIRSREPDPSPRVRRQMMNEIAVGIRFVWRQQILRTLTIACAAYNFFSTFLTAMFLVLLARELQLSSGTIGLVFSLAGLGGLVGALLAPGAARVIGQGRTIVLASAVVAVGDLAIPFAQRGWLTWLAAVGNGIGTLAVVASVITQLSFRQRLCPRHLLGRVTATMRLLAWSTVPLGAFVGGVLGQAVGVRTTLWIGAAGVIAAGVPIYLSPLVKARTWTTAEKPVPALCHVSHAVPEPSTHMADSRS